MTPALISEIWISGEAVAWVAFKCLGSRVTGKVNSSKIHIGDYRIYQELHSILTGCLRPPAYECYVAHMESASDDDLISSIAPDVMKSLGRCGFFEKLDGLLSPEDNSIPSQGCEGSYKLSEPILVTAGFGRAELDDIFAVL